MKKSSKNNQKGSMLLEGLVSITVFSFASLSIMSFQANQIAQTSHVTAKLEASMLVNSVIGAAEADYANYTCYTYPAVNSAANCAVATSYVATWATKVTTQKGVKLTPVIALDADKNLVATVSWSEGQSAIKNVTSVIHPLPVI